MTLKANVNSWVHFFIEKNVNKDSIVLDLTLGNGNDALALASRARFLYGFDIQSKAIRATQELLKKNHLIEKSNLYLECHSKIIEYIPPGIDFIVMNLGYLPKGDKSVITKWETTKVAIEEGLSVLHVGGLFLLSLYRSHLGAEEEVIGVESFMNNLDQKIFNVTEISFPNQKNMPPKLFIIERISI